VAGIPFLLSKPTQPGDTKSSDVHIPLWNATDSRLHAAASFHVTAASIPCSGNLCLPHVGCADRSPLGERLFRRRVGRARTGSARPTRKSCSRIGHHVGDRGAHHYRDIGFPVVV